MKHLMLTILTWAICTLAYGQKSYADSSLIHRLGITSNILLIKCDVSVEHYNRTEICIFYQYGAGVVGQLLIASSETDEAMDTVFILSEAQRNTIEQFAIGIKTHNMAATGPTLGGTSGRYSYDIGDERRECSDGRNHSLAKLLLNR